MEITMKSSTGPITYIARAGYCSKAIIYGVLGAMILYGAFYSGSVEDIDKAKIFNEIESTTLGSVLLGAVFIGLVGYVIWRLVQFVTNPDDLDNSDASDLMKRGFYFVSALIYGTVAYTAFEVLSGTSKQQEGGKQSMSESLMSQTWGVYLLLAIGVVIVVFAGIQLKHAIKQDFMDKFETNQLSQKAQDVIKLSGRAGYLGRTATYVLVGGFIITAAIQNDPSEAGGLGKALVTILETPFGPYLLGAVGLGMLCFGVFCGFEGRYRDTGTAH